MKLPIFKKLIFLLIGILLFGISFGVGIVNAQVPPPTTTCTTANPEFHSLRPYQASPCQTTLSPTAKFCGNTLTLQDQIDISYRPGIDNCSQPANGKVTCNYIVPKSETITINLSDAKLPIMGNTENVPNSQSPAGEPPALSDVDKVNGYVSWYLNGVMNRAEDGSSKNTDSNIVNFSGPLNKLLPSAILDAQRIQTINNVAAKTNHNQIVVCASSNWGALGDIVGIGSLKPNPCYTDPLEKRLRLSDWQSGGLSLFNTITNAIGDITPDMFKGLVGQQWNHRFPPLPWNDGAGKPFATEDLYQKAYQEWRGNTCITVPIINKTLCIDNPLVTNKWANLYSFIPLSSTEDTKGSVQVDSVSVGGPTITNISFSNQTPSTLFFPHLTETDQLGSTLQKTYLAKGAAETGSDIAVEPPESCNTVDVRSNAGDKLFATQLSGVLGYTASFSCTFSSTSTENTTTTGTCTRTCTGNRYCLPDANGGTCVTDIPARTPYCSRNCLGSNNHCQPDVNGGTCVAEVIQASQTCSKTVSIALSTSTSVPKLNDIWSRLVGGPTAIVKRLFPQLGSQIGTLKDMPGTTSITYTGAAASSGQLNLPHVGGISEYFLKGIQTLLRPKGYGEPISFGATGPAFSCKSNTLPNIPKATDNACKICNAPSNLPQIMIDIMEAAGQAYHVPASVIYATFMYEGGDHYQWNDSNALSASICGGEIPNCNKNATTAQPPYGFFPVYFYNGFWDAVKVIDPGRTKEETSPCNFLDATFAAAKSLSQWASGLPTSVRFPVSQDPSQTFSRFPDTCYGFNLNNGSGVPASCGAWNANTVATTQVGYAGYCAEPGKHPTQSYFTDNPEDKSRLTGVVSYYNSLKCQ